MTAPRPVSKPPAPDEPPGWREHAMKAVRWLVNSITFRQYSLIQAAGWLAIGNFAAGHLSLWLIALIALGIGFAAAILTDLLRMAAGLAPDRHAGKTVPR